MNLFNKPVTKFATKSGKEIVIYSASMDKLPELLKFVNRLVAEDTYLNLSGRAKTLEEEKFWLKSKLDEIKKGKSRLFWAACDRQIVGSVDLTRGSERSLHTGEIGLMVDKDFRDDGIGKFLMQFILKEAESLDIKIATLKIFHDNIDAIKLYEKLGFAIYGRLPEGLYRKEKFSDTIEMYKKLSSFAPTFAEAMAGKKATEDK